MPSLVANKPLTLRYAAVFLIVAGSVCAIQATERGRAFERGIVSPLEHSFRHDVLNRVPRLDDRIKTYAFDNAAASALQTEDLRIADWTRLIAMIARNKPSFIFIDKLFRVVPDDKGDIEAFAEVLRAAPPVIFGSFGTSETRAWVPRLSLDREEFDPRRYLENPDDPTWHSWFQEAKNFAEGPHPDLLPAIQVLGHVNYDGSGRIEPFVNIANRAMIPHAALTIAETLKLHDGFVEINGTAVTLDGDGFLPVNFPPQPVIFDRIYSLLPLIERSRRGGSSTLIKEGDIVVILPLYFTGNVDVGMTPVGRIARGIVPLYSMNSVLTGEWLRPIRQRALIVAAATLVGVLLSYLLAPALFWLCFVGCAVALVVGSLLAFGYFGWILPWFYSSIAYSLAGIVSFALRMQARELTSRTMEQAFNGLLPAGLIDEIVRNPAAIKREASEEFVSILFLDIVGFSAFAASESPKVVFERLKKSLNQFSRMVHEHGGLVDKTLGDGLLAFFGYSYTGRPAAQNHADAAIDCACAIHKDHLDRNLEDIAKGGIGMPLRIGLNTANVYIGDIGDHRRIDFTVIGDGVNFAQRLESACAPYMINISEATLAAASRFSKSSPGFVKRTIPIKHQSELYDVFEINPFFDELEKLAKGMDAYRATHNLVRKYSRRLVLQPELLGVSTDHGQAKLIDYSKNGLSILLPSYLASGIEINLTFKSPVSWLEDALTRVKLVDLRGEVRWSKPLGKGFAHGILLKGLNKEQQATLYRVLHELFANDLGLSA